MRLPDDAGLVRLARIPAALSLALALGACGIMGGSGLEPAPLALAPANGPEADFPVVIGTPYTVGNVTYTPVDVLNYDEVGFVTADAAGGRTISGSHHTLPLPSYIEVTSLETGRTILVRVERRGPMNGHELLGLSPGAMAELEAAPGHPVRVRRVNPPEDHRAMLRAGEGAPPRMDTPMALVEVLRRKLPAQGSGSYAVAPPQPTALPQSVPVPASSAARSTAPALPPLTPRNEDVSAFETPASVARPYVPPPPAPSRPVNEGAFVVQAAAFSSAERARRAASALGGDVSRSGDFYRVRTGPFATRGEAEASLAKVRAAGYTDARIFTSG